MTTIQFSFGGQNGSPTIHVAIQETSATKAVQQMDEFTEAWMARDESCEDVLDLPNADFNGEKN